MGDKNKSKFSIYKIYKFFTNCGKYFCVEILMVFFLVPSHLLNVVEQNFSLEKACRVNLQLSDDICDNMINKAKNNINCVALGKKMNMNSSNELLAYIEYLNITELDVNVCNAESRSQVIETNVNYITSPLEYISIVVLIVVVTWSDRKGVRKPCMILPLIGLLCSHIVFLIAVIFMKQLPMQFSSILCCLMVALGGGPTLMNAGVYSYLSSMFTEEKRSQRFAIFGASLTAVGVVTNLFAGKLFQQIGYMNLIFICIPIDIIGILYVIFVIKEIESPPSTAIENYDETNTTISHQNNNNTNDNDTTSNGIDNLACDVGTITNNNDVLAAHSDTANNNNNNNQNLNKNNKTFMSKCFGFIQINKRSPTEWLIIIILLFLFMLTLIPIYGESANEYNFARTQLNWNEIDQNYYLSYTSGLYLAGMFLTYGILMNLPGLKNISDALLGLFSSILSTVSRSIFVIVTTTTMMYLARSLDMFMQVRAVSIKSLLSAIVSETEWGKSFAACGVIEGISKHVGISVYSKIYNETKDSNIKGAIYICSFILLALSTILFFALHFILKYQQKHKIEKSENLSYRNDESIITNNKNEQIITHM